MSAASVANTMVSYHTREPLSGGRSTGLTDASGPPLLLVKEGTEEGPAAGCLPTVALPTSSTKPCYAPSIPASDERIAAGAAPSVALYDVRRSSSTVPLPGPLPYPSSLGQWSCRVLLESTPKHRILAFPSTFNSDFDSELRSFCDGFLSPVTSPPPRRTYDPSNPLHMADLSTRFMGIGDERLRRTIELNRGLLPATGRVPVHPFPQGKFRQEKLRASAKEKSIT